MLYKKWIITGLLLCAALLIFFKVSAPDVTNAPDVPPSTIIAFGDSLVYGYGAKRGEDYPAQLARLCDCSVINKGVSGDTTHDGLRRLQTDVLNLNPEVVIVTLGGNDMLQKLSRDQSNENLKTIISQIQDKGAMVVLTEVRAPAFINSYGPDYKAVAKETKSLFVPNIISGISTNIKLRSDQIHPNAEGYKLLAERVYAKLKKFL